MSSSSSQSRYWLRSSARAARHIEPEDDNDNMNNAEYDAEYDEDEYQEVDDDEYDVMPNTPETPTPAPVSQAETVPHLHALISEEGGVCQSTDSDTQHE
jgi:hypothetical protein